MTEATRAAIVLVVAALALAPAHAGGARAPSEPVWNDASQHVFFAVLEGLYEDGVSTEAVELLIGPPSLPPEKRFARTFVYGCPLCHPAYEALVLYGVRGELYGQKRPVDTLGPGLAPSEMERLQSSDEAVRRDVAQELVARWVSRRLARLDLSEADRADLARQMEKSRAQGERLLKAEQARGGTGWRSCAACDGSVAGSRREGPIIP